MCGLREVSCPSNSMGAAVGIPWAQGCESDLHRKVTFCNDLVHPLFCWSGGGNQGQREK